MNVWAHSRSVRRLQDGGARYYTPPIARHSTPTVLGLISWHEQAESMYVESSEVLIYLRQC